MNPMAQYMTPEQRARLAPDPMRRNGQANLPAQPTLGQMDQMRAQQMQATGSDPGLEVAKLNAMRANQLQNRPVAQQLDEGQMLNLMREELQRAQSDPNVNKEQLQKAVQQFQQREQAFAGQKPQNVGPAPQLQNMGPQGDLTMVQMDKMKAQQAAAQGNAFAQGPMKPPALAQAEQAMQKDLKAKALGAQQAPKPVGAQPNLGPAPQPVAQVAQPPAQPSVQPASQGVPGPTNWRAPKPRRWGGMGPKMGGMMPKPPGMQ